MPAGAARNALDCALWDYEAKRAGASVPRSRACLLPRALTTAYTISLDAPTPWRPRPPRPRQRCRC